MKIWDSVYIFTASTPVFLTCGYYQQADKHQTDRFFDTIYGRMWIFLSIKFAVKFALLSGG